MQNTACSIGYGNETTQVVETVLDIKKLGKDIKVSTDDLREVLLLFMGKLSTPDLLYSIITMESEYEQRKYGYR